ncbi:MULTISPECIES: hypothetical protein [unclassified Mesorhizobium]|uniref:hypothetical protein n=1 Tax=unclassified Mesorhizobium TaxID=325217 RepID=UPI000BAF33C8|nr:MULTISPECIES: hypothetical protein [unclassified Mesorhizobium]TGT60418.1 hypothetical protein EN813_022230 [Mesorhizobium sp. M00.F.Ca.ET.170.01.1.1]AZO10476.1 hypothetical protein EJ074_16075 [Mesorhizobium sp. M3A.F.Ca.ET.080.04.2.1]PBB88000.1 hypothetical protein CK216_05615 [Mesorhizobium sp. WSM3876]RWB69134.1 MAG: hypothetical protein EOQ49_21105 [Mesorhizobium sp.]RWB84217.1 MAG: hypothetical protein EOQ52_25055 [Mesorhizobium sp.]
MDSLIIQDAFTPYYSGCKRFAGSERVAGAENGEPAARTKDEEVMKPLPRPAVQDVPNETESTTEH